MFRTCGDPSRYELENSSEFADFHEERSKMNEMVERVARVISAGLCVSMDDARPVARDILQAMREPTEAMLHGYDDLSGCYTGFWASDREEIRSGYQAMIDAALKEQSA